MIIIVDDKDHLNKDRLQYVNISSLTWFPELMAKKLQPICQLW